MTAVTFLSDLFAVSAQLASVIVVAAVLARVVRIDAAAVRYEYWRAVLVFCLILPWFQPRRATASVVETIAFPSSYSVVFWSTSGAAAPAAGISWIAVAMWIVLAGVVIRLARVGYGLLRLRGIRRSGQLAPANVDHDELQRVLGTNAEIRYVSHGHPVTCGLWRPVVLLPEDLTSHPEEIQRAVLAHELLHVQRRDWMWVMSEEVLRAVFWFHPGIWWLVSRVRLAREEVVDDLTVGVTGRRRSYLEALLAFADAAPFAPGAAFARRRHLFRRMTLISKEAVMSSRRIVVSCAVLVAGVLAGSWYAVQAFPLAQAPGLASAATLQPSSVPGPLERSAKAITPENPIPRRIYAVTPQYPAGGDGAVAGVNLRVTLNALGRVAEMRATERVLMTGNVQVGDGDRPRITAERVVSTNHPGPDVFLNAAVDALRQWVYEPPADAPISFGVTLLFTPGSETRLLAYGGPGVEAGATAPATAEFLASQPPPPPWVREGTTLANPVHIGGAIQATVKIYDVRPVYPAIAQSAKVTGVVNVEAIIGPEGRIDQVRVVKSVPLLDQAAMDAVKEWRFTPTVVNGVAVPVIITAMLSFTLK